MQTRPACGDAAASCCGATAPLPPGLLARAQASDCRSCPSPALSQLSVTSSVGGRAGCGVRMSLESKDLTPNLSGGKQTVAVGSLGNCQPSLLSQPSGCPSRTGKVASDMGGPAVCKLATRGEEPRPYWTQSFVETSNRNCFWQTNLPFLDSWQYSCNFNM